MRASNVVMKLERMAAQEHLVLPFVHKVIWLWPQDRIEEGFASLSNAINMFRMVQEEREYYHDYYRPKC